MDWGICITAHAPEDQLRAFLAHHLELGASHIWLHLDDPADPVADALKGIDRVTVIPCDDAWWGKRRPDRHQNRQSRNMRRLYDAAPLPWIAHLDVDEFILPHRPVAEVLAASDAILVRMRPWEALHDPARPSGLFAARTFRAPLRDLEQRIAAFDDHAPAMASGALSHIVGKAFFRTGVPGLEPRLHGGFLNKERITGIGFTEDLPLLHFHAQDREAWLQRLPFRLERGAYTNNAPLNDFLSSASDDQIRAFYDAVMSPPAPVLDRLREDGLLIEADLDLARKAAAL